MVFGLGIGILDTPILRAVSLGVIQELYAAGALGRGWLWCIVAIAGAGTAINASFAARPTPRAADIADRLSLGMVLARLLP